MKFLKEEQGVALTEYVIMLLILVVGISGTLFLAGDSIKDIFGKVANKINPIVATVTFDTYELLSGNNAGFPDLIGLNELIVDEESFKDYQFVLNGQAVCVKFNGWSSESILDVPECEGMTLYTDTRLRLGKNEATDEWRIVVNTNNYKIDENCTDYHQCYNPEWELEVINR